MRPTSYTTFIILTAFIVAAGAYWYFFVNNGAEPPLTSDTISNQAQIEFQTLASQLDTIVFDTSIFADPRFNALRALTTPIAPEPAGRTDPFAPLAGVSAP